MFYIFIDLEMNEILNKTFKYKNEIIQIAAIKYDRNNKIIGNFNRLVKPTCNEIVSKISNLTGITNENVKNCKNFNEIMKEFLDFCGENYTIFAWSENDYRQIKKECEMKQFEDDRLIYMYKNWRDFQKEFCKLIGLKKGHYISLDLALSVTGNSFNGKRHNAYYDAKNTAYLYKISRNKEKFQKEFQNLDTILFPKQEKYTLEDIVGKEIFDSFKKE